MITTEIEKLHPRHQHKDTDKVFKKQLVCELFYPYLYSVLRCETRTWPETNLPEE